MRIDELLDGRSVDFRYVPAHQVDGDPLNDFADRAASQAAKVQEPAGSALGSAEPPPSADTPKASAPRRKPAASRQRGDSSRTLKAKFPGRCLCGRSYAAGETIAKNAQGWGTRSAVRRRPVRASAVRQGAGRDAASVRRSRRATPRTPGRAPR